MRAACVFTLAVLLAAPVRALDCRRIEQAAVTATVCSVDLRRDDLQLFWRNPHGKALQTFDALRDMLHEQGRDLLFAMNAGMYRPDFSPSGLYVAQGRQLRALNTQSGHGNFYLKPNGVFAVNRAGAHVVETSQYPALSPPVLLATQSGPLLLHDGVINPAFGPASSSRLIRNGVGVSEPGHAQFVIAETPVNFHDFAQFFRETLQCPNALYLDGNVSSLFSVQAGRDDTRTLLGPMLGVSAPAPPAPPAQ